MKQDSDFVPCNASNPSPREMRLGLKCYLRWRHEGPHYSDAWGADEPYSSWPRDSWELPPATPERGDARETDGARNIKNDADEGEASRKETE